MTDISVDIWSDFLCPWCYIGKRRFERALADFDQAADVQVRWRSYDLHPDEKKEPDLTIPRRLERDLGLSRAHAEASVVQVNELAAELGLSYRMQDALLVNSFDAHRLAHFANAQGLGEEFRERLMSAYTGEGVNIADHDTLVRLAADAGLDKDEARTLLDGEDFTDEVRADHREGRKYGVSGVPTVIVNGKYLVSGAQSSDAYLQVLQRAAQG